MRHGFWIYFSEFPFWDKVLRGELGLDRFDGDEFCSEDLAAHGGEA
jgi:hypothetical protein